ncbi:hypothetical protein CR513_55825 [Mucuna pruriens]|uniref:Coenzyme Q-binding protein COQ10 START domain-containing protein n=1 Tax=Mucuna pruriens TaxID=157652 RepID=A0A371EHH9_MUCPR|nr:hypothetical protein CR513_55825 [Mucuna pruriens]
MSAAIVGSISTTQALPLTGLSSTRRRTAFAANSPSTSFPATPLVSNLLFFRLHHTCSSKRTSTFHGFKRFSPVMEWQDSTVKMEIDVPVSVAYACYSDREAIAKWMPFISSVKILPDKPDLSRWSLKYKAFGRDIEFSWLARNMQEKIPNLIYITFVICCYSCYITFLQPIPNQKIHWRSMEGLPNRGAVRFYPKGPSSCVVELTVSYEVPQLLTPVASALQPFLEGLLQRGLERFATFAKSYKI